MADQQSPVDVTLLKKTTISVFVDEALPDILVCTYEHGVQIFKGVLLDSTKSNLPCGVQALNPAYTAKPEQDPLYSVNQRFAYTDPQNQQNQKKKNVHISTKYKNSKMTVRLRPRQVLCSKCKGICNENSENVGRKRKISDRQPSPVPIVKRSSNAPVTRSANSQEPTSSRRKTAAEDKTQSENSKETQKEKDPPKEKETQKSGKNTQQDAPAALSGNVNKLNIDNNSKKPLTTVTNLNNKCGSTINSVNSAISSKLDDTHSLEHSEINSNSVKVIEEEEEEEPKTVRPRLLDPNSKQLKRTLRKKRSVGSMEDLWDETVFEEKGNKNLVPNPNNPLNDPSTCPSTRTIKISYGPQGEGTVLKIPAQIENLNVSDDSEENVNVDDLKSKGKDTINKAARKALKKAKKEARRKVLMSNSPMYGSGSPRYALSPRYSIGNASPRHGLGNNSPRYLGNPSFDPNTPRKRKHKMKHKKKHREDKERKHKDSENAVTSDDANKEQIVTQKLSINLKRLNNTYTSVVEKAEDSSSDDNSEQVPDFPPPNPPLMLRINAKTVSSAPGADGSRLLVGDVVWGKILGFPWWPGKVLTITNTDNQPPQAHVAWYGSCTSSLMQCDQLSPYLENFKVRYNKKKRGAYKEAIKQATTEARENAENRLREPLASSPARSIITVVPPALASPREIDVVS